MSVFYTLLEPEEVQASGPRRFVQVRTEAFDDLAAMMCVEHRWPTVRCDEPRQGDARKMARAA